MLVVGLTGCVTTPTQQKRVETGLKVAAQIGGAIILTENPELRPGFLRAIEDLKVIESGTNTVSVHDVLAIIQRADIKELKSPQAALYVNSAILLLNEFGVPTEVPLEQSAQAKAYARALREGLEVAIEVVQPDAEKVIAPEPTPVVSPPVTN